MISQQRAIGRTTIALGVAAVVAVAAISFLAITRAPLQTSGIPQHSTSNTPSTSTMTPGTSTVRTNTSTSTFARWEPAYMTSNQGCAAGPPWTPYPCWGNRSDAVVFSCAAAAETPEGCTQRVQVTNSTGNFNVTVWFNFTGNHVLADGQQGNCTWNVDSAEMYIPPPPALCLSVSSATFLLAEPHSTAPA